MLDTRFTVTKLNNENYQVWKFIIELMLIKENFCGIKLPQSHQRRTTAREKNGAKGTIKHEPLLD